MDLNLFLLLFGFSLIFFGLGFWFGNLNSIKKISEIKDEFNKERIQLEKEISRNQSDIKNLKLINENQQKENTEFINQSKKDFQNIAKAALVENSLNLNQNSISNFDSLLKPFKETITKWEANLVDEKNKQREEILNLKFLVEQLTTANVKISEDANQLTRALRGESKTRGNWGEAILERLLDSIGLIKGIHYLVQESFQNEDGNIQRPDIIVKLPNDRDIVIDSKVSLVAYEKYINAQDELDKKAFLKEHILSIEKHTKELSNKAYHSLDRLVSPDFVFLFIPIEGALITFLENNNNSYNFMLERNIIPVSTSTLALSLRLTNYLWRIEKQNLNAKEFARIGGELHDRIVDFLKDFNVLGNSITMVSKHFDSTEKKIIGGNKSILNKAIELKDLGANTTKILPEIKDHLLYE